MTTDTQERIRHLARIHRGNSERPDFLLRLSAGLASEITEGSLTDLESADKVLRCMGSGYAAAKQGREPGYAKRFSRGDEDSVFKLLSCLQTKLIDRRALAYFRQSEFCGAVDIDVSFALAHAGSLLEIDGNGLNIIAVDHKDGLMLDYSPDDYEECYELVVWGATWPLFLLACL